MAKFVSFSLFLRLSTRETQRREGFIAEDLQWFDPTSIDLGHALSDR
jgi:hypothetical protein